MKTNLPKEPTLEQLSAYLAEADKVLALMR